MYCFKNMFQGMGCADNGIVRGIPMMRDDSASVWGAYTNAQQPFLNVDPTAPPQQGMDGAHDLDEKTEAKKYLEQRSMVVNARTGGMYFQMKHLYQTSFYLEAVMFRAESGQLVLCQSTSESNGLSQYRRPGFPGFELWASYDADHNEGMPLTPPYDKCSPLGRSLYDVYGDIGSWQHFQSIEDLLEAAGVEEYAKMICGYHIQGAIAGEYPSTEGIGYEYCPLDWYVRVVKKSAGYEQSDTWQHYLLLDVVCPTQFYESRVFRKVGEYTGWEGHRIGAASC